jgi:hypothetical protein
LPLRVALFAFEARFLKPELTSAIAKHANPASVFPGPASEWNSPAERPNLINRVGRAVSVRPIEYIIVLLLIRGNLLQEISITGYFGALSATTVPYTVNETRIGLKGYRNEPIGKQSYSLVAA